MSDAIAIASIGDAGITRVTKTSGNAEAVSVASVTRTVPGDSVIVIRTNKERGALFRVILGENTPVPYIESVGCPLPVYQSIWIPPNNETEIHAQSQVTFMLRSSSDDGRDDKLTIHDGGQVQTFLRHLTFKIWSATFAAAQLDAKGPTIFVGGPDKERNHYVATYLINALSVHGESPKLLNLDPSSSSPYPHLNNLPDSICCRSYPYRIPPILSYMLLSTKEVTVPLFDFSGQCICSTKEKLFQAAVALNSYLDIEINKNISDIYIHNILTDSCLGRKYMDILAEDGVGKKKLVARLPPSNAPSLLLLHPFGDGRKEHYTNSKSAPHIVLLPEEMFTENCPSCTSHASNLFLRLSLLFKPDLFIDTSVEPAPYKHAFEGILSEWCQRIEKDIIGGYFAMQSGDDKLPFSINVNQHIYKRVYKEGSMARYQWLSHFFGTAPLPEQVSSALSLQADAGLSGNLNTEDSAVLVTNVAPSPWNSRRIGIPLSFWSPAQSGLFHISPSSISVTGIIGELEGRIEKEDLISSIVASEVDSTFLDEVCESILRSREFLMENESHIGALKVKTCANISGAWSCANYTEDLELLSNALGYLIASDDLPFGPTFGAVQIESIEPYIDTAIDGQKKTLTQLEDGHIQKLLTYIYENGGVVVKMQLSGSPSLMKKLKEDIFQYQLIISSKPNYPNRWLRLEEYNILKRAADSRARV